MASFRPKKRKLGLATKIRHLPIGKSAVVGYTDDEAQLLKFNDRSNLLSDPFENVYDFTAATGSEYQPLAPSYDFQRLAHIITISNILRQCIEAMVTNTTAYGYTLEYVGPEGKEKGPEPQAEKRTLSALLNNPSPGESLREILERSVWDKETLGFRAWEVIKEDTGEVLSFNHVPSITLRKTKKDRRPTEYLEERVDPETGEIELVKQVRRFGRYVQKIGNSTVYFKEFGDPRSIDSRTGKEFSKSDEDEDNLATEIIWDEFYTPGSVYGQPRWMGVLPAILGSRESELVNLNFFRENAIPAMAVLVSGGALTHESYENLQQYITAVRGADAMHRVMVLEASGEETGDLNHSAPSPRVDMKPMISDRQQDGLFKDYDNHNIVKIRSSFRLPPILVGKAEDYTRASALASVQTAENQVFMPERAYVDDIINGKILATYKPRFWRFRSLGPSTTDAEELATVVDSLGAQGALTPNVVIKLANKMLGIYIEPVLDTWGDYPFALIEQFVKNGADIEGLDEFVTNVKPATVASAAKPNPQTAGGKGKIIPLEQARTAVKRRKLRSNLAAVISRIEKQTA